MEGFNCNTFNFNNLPQDCLASIISFTTSRDASRLSLVSTTFKSAAESDPVWESFLPSQYQDLIPESLSFASKKHLYLYLSENHVLIDDGKKSLSLERESGKKCYMLAPRDLFIVWSDTPTYWRWISIPEARFREIPVLLDVCWFEIRGKISISMLSPLTHYKAYLVYKGYDISVYKGDDISVYEGDDISVYEGDDMYGFEYFPVRLRVGLVDTEGSKGFAYLDPKLRDWEIASRQEHTPTPSADDQYPKTRGDGWLEIEMGEFFNEGCIDDEELEMSALEIDGGNWKGGLVIQGIEIRATPNL